MKFQFSISMVLAAMLSSAAIAQLSPTPSGATPPPMEFDQFILVLLVRPPNPPEIPKPELAQLQDGHMANIRRLHAEGKLLKAGPTEDQSGRDVRGIFILTTDSVEKAREWVGSDPLIKRGRLVAEYLKWYVEKGSLK
ncbi:MAG: YciI family protein [Verrucomicrobiota bacterium]